MGLDVEMIAKVPHRLTDEEVKRVAVRMQTAFGADGILWVERGKHHCLSLLDPTDYKVSEAELPNDGSSYVGLNTLSRFYGPGYTRGDLVNILAVARYLRTAFKDSEIYYGSDSGGGLSLLDDEYEAELWSTFTSEASRDYYNHTRDDETTTVCDFCEVRTNTYSFSAVECITVCPSCRAEWKWTRATNAHTLIVKNKGR